MDDRSDRRALERALDAPPPRNIEPALALCRDREHVRGAQVLRRQLLGADWEVARTVAIGLGACAPRLARELLTRALAHRDKAVRQEAAASLLVALGLLQYRYDQQFERLRAWLASPVEAVRSRGLRTLDEVLERRAHGTPMAGLDAELRVERPSPAHTQFWDAVHAGLPLPVELLAALDIDEWLWTEVALLHRCYEDPSIELIDALRAMESTLLRDFARQMLQEERTYAPDAARAFEELLTA